MSKPCHVTHVINIFVIVLCNCTCIDNNSSIMSSIMHTAPELYLGFKKKIAIKNGCSAMWRMNIWSFWSITSVVNYHYRRTLHHYALSVNAGNSLSIIPSERGMEKCEFSLKMNFKLVFDPLLIVVSRWFFFC